MDQASTLREIVKSRDSQKKGGEGLTEGETRVAQVFAVTSGKGGVGKTNIVANLAIAFQAMNRKVLILDGDMGLANIDIVYNLSPKYSIRHLLNGSKTIDEVLVAGPKGVMVLPGASGIQELTALTEQEKANLIAQMEGVQDRFDVLLLDTPAGISKNVMYLNSAAQAICVVVSPEPTSITDAYALIKVMSSQYSEKEFKVIVNSARSEKEANDVYQSIQRAADQFLEYVVLEYVDYIPFDENVRKAVRNQRPFYTAYPDSAASRAIERIAQKLAVEKSHRVKGGMQFFFQKIMNTSRG